MESELPSPKFQIQLTALSERSVNADVTGAQMELELIEKFVTGPETPIAD